MVALVKYVLIGLLLVSLASLQFFHELRHGAMPNAADCITPESKRAAVKDMLLHHQQHHR
jgi:hypothetical protein